mmetsp:Transcript_1152/g.1874  ORF Transcript_1152/g.1874 Transcript_1152/m.1874 type:complete len:214 (-) Transcript_1152:37-678(-)
MLGGNDDGVDTQRLDLSVFRLLVLHGNLSLTVWSNPRANALLAHLGQPLRQLGGVQMGERHHLLRLVSGVTKHVALVTCSEVFNIPSNVHTSRDLRALSVDLHKDPAGLIIQSLLLVVESDPLNGLTDDCLVIDLGGRGDLSKDHCHAGLGRGLTGDLGKRVLCETGVEDGVTEGVAELVWMTRAHGLGGEEERLGRHGCCCLFGFSLDKTLI